MVDIDVTFVVCLLGLVGVLLGLCGLAAVFIGQTRDEDDENDEARIRQCVGMARDLSACEPQGKGVPNGADHEAAAELPEDPMAQVRAGQTLLSRLRAEVSGGDDAA